MKPRVFISRTIPPKPLGLIESECEVFVWDEDIPPTHSQLFQAVTEVDGIVSMLTERIDNVLLSAASNLKVISNYAVGYDNIDVDSATERNIPVGNTPDVLTEATADQAFALLMAAARRLMEGVAYVRNDQWKTWNPAVYQVG